MTRLTIANSGNNQTLSPISPSITRETKDGKLNISTLLFGTHYNISMDGVIDTTTSGNGASSALSVHDGKLDLEIKKSGATIPKYSGIFNTTMYFYPGTKLKGHLELDESSTSSSPVPDYFGDYVITDLVSNDRLIIRLSRLASRITFQLLEQQGSIITEHPSTQKLLGSGVVEVEFEFRYLENGKSAIYIVTKDSDYKQSFERIWKGDLIIQLNECTVELRLTNESTTVKHVQSDYFYIYYPIVYLSYDATADDILIGQIVLYDDNNSLDIDNRDRIISRDYNFKGNRIIENGIIRMIITTENPTIELWGYNYGLTVPLWEKFAEIVPINAENVKASFIQNITIEHFTINQMKLKINFGNTIYHITISRGCPYITILTKYTTKFHIYTPKNRITGDFTANNNYDLNSAKANGNPSVRSSTKETLTSPSMRDNWWSWYTNNGVDEMIAWMSNLIYPSKVVITNTNDEIDTLYTYDYSANLISVGCLIGSPNVESNNIPIPYIVGNDDTYVKYRANEGLISFRQSNFIRRRQVQ